MKTILFVEDDPVILQAYSPKLKSAGYNVELAPDGLTAMKLLVQLKPDLVLLDIMIPKLDGNDVLRFVRSTDALKATPIVILSNASMADLSLEARSLGAESIFLKSQCTPAQLLEAVNQIFTKPAAAS